MRKFLRVFVPRWRKYPVLCQICGSCFFQVVVSLNKHPRSILKSKMNSIKDEAQCTRCGARYGVINPGKRDFKLLMPNGSAPEYWNYATQLRAWDAQAAEDRFSIHQNYGV